MALSGLLGVGAAAEQRSPAIESAGEPADLSVADIVVTAERAALSRRIGAFVSSITPETGNDQVARWDRHLCLRVEGVSAAQQAYFAGTIADAGREVGLDIDRNRICEPSVYVIFSRDPNGLLNRIDESRPDFFGAIPPDRQIALAASTGPVRWLSFAQLRGAAGERPTGFSIDIGKGGVERTIPSLRSTPSRLREGGRSDLQSMVVLVDASRLAGVSNRSLAAFLSMVVLGNVRPDHQAGESPSILGLFAAARPGAVVTEGLTEWDWAYLRSLYAGVSNVPAGQRMHRIGAAMERELVSLGPPDSR